MGAPVVHWEINTKDPNKVFGFYSTLFGWKIDANNPINYGVVDTNVKMGINGGIWGTREGSSQFVTFYVQVEDPQGYLDRAVSLGAKVVLPVTDIPNMAMYALFEDPDGNRVGLIKGPQSPPKKSAGGKRSSAKRESSRGKKRGKRRARR